MRWLILIGIGIAIVLALIPYINNISNENIRVNAIISLDKHQLDASYKIDEYSISDLNLVLDGARSPLDGLLMSTNFTAYIMSDIDAPHYILLGEEMIEMKKSNGIYKVRYLADTLPSKLIIKDGRELNIPIKPIIKESSYYYEVSKIKINGVELMAELADTQEKRRLGLMYRDYLPERGGMLFILDREDQSSFWMMNMHIGLDIIWIDNDYKIIHITEHAKPCTDEISECTYKPDEPAKYVLEVNAGFSKKYNIREGDIVEIEPLWLSHPSSNPTK